MPYYTLTILSWSYSLVLDVSRSIFFSSGFMEWTIGLDITQMTTGTVQLKVIIN